jgi:hypothetical protein
VRQTKNVPQAQVAGCVSACYDNVLNVRRGRLPGLTPIVGERVTAGTMLAL